MYPSSLCSFLVQAQPCRQHKHLAPLGNTVPPQAWPLAHHLNIKIPASWIKGWAPLCPGRRMYGGGVAERCEVCAGLRKSKAELGAFRRTVPLQFSRYRSIIPLWEV